MIVVNLFCLGIKLIKISPEIMLNFLSEKLSKILCKWKQDSVVGFFLYLDSVFKHKHNLIHNQAPV